VTGILIATVRSESEWQELADQRGRPCACAGAVPCLAHYAMADNATRARVRRTVGIVEFQGRRA
jgi:hypothetical protein